MSRIHDPQQVDRWSVWFNRLMQMAGLCIILYESSRSHAQLDVLLVAVAMMLGNLGLRLMLRGAANFLSDALEESER